ncbi:MAG TPA: hypothetical protein DHV15_11960 [Treponema sp.]|uniref:Uncharacterized protein n=1 Tax=Treponema denticola (strain ATCC 35405 / DSM 14222 / CIP 103919 / JCM 8153 / KCTC 15104) TaxID=243275 RepID=Q73MS3_TREDE|nr:hypothetical protein TDE_1434 [Treponema denticola ATCC 35405]HCY96202.1 hypothetical protein [Treponema sp.]
MVFLLPEPFALSLYTATFSLIKAVFATKYNVVIRPITMEKSILPVPGSMYNKRIIMPNVKMGSFIFAAAFYHTS